MKDLRINVRASKEMKFNLEGIKSLVQLQTGKKYSDSEILRICLQYSINNAMDLLNTLKS